VSVGFLAGNQRHAVLCDFLVNPEHRGKGIGLAVLHRRLNIAAKLSIPYLYADLAPTNNLRHHYEALGFIASGSLYFRATRLHPMEKEALAVEKSI
jgi:GNAT superfamily N-acetyltransferase